MSHRRKTISSIRKPIAQSILVLVIILFLSLVQAQESPFSNSLLLVTDNADHTELAIHPVNPLSLQDVPGYTPFSLGHHYVAAFSPDRKTLAAVLWSASSGTNGTLHLIDLTTWQDQQTTATFGQYVTAFTFSPDGNALYWLSPTKTDATHGMQFAYTVFTCDIAHCDSPNTVVTLEDDLAPQEAKLLKSGSQLAIYGIPIDTNGVTKHVPQIIVVDLLQKRIASTIRLEGLNAGLRPVDNAQIPFEYNQPGLAWDIAKNRLYIAHPLADHFTIVDLAQGTEQNMAVTRNKVLSKSKGTLPGMDQLAALNPVGDQLFVSSFRRDVTANENGTFRVSMQPLGIQQIDTSDMEQVQVVNLPLFEMALSPNGTYLVATGMQTDIPDDGSDWKTAASGLYILNGTDLQIKKHFEIANNMINLYGFSEDSRYTYIDSFDTSTAGPVNMLRVIDLSNLSIAAERTLPAGYLALLGTLNTTP